MKARVLIATRNPDKRVELCRILAAHAGAVQLCDLSEFPELGEVVETGATFEENALLKARSAAAATGLVAVADDSGLCVDALGGMPGVLSARWAGRHGDDQANLELVLGQLADVPDERRGAAFVCAAAVVGPDGREVVRIGRLAGSVLRAPRGTGGFGYDPIFLPLGAQRSTAELSAPEKDAISHRGLALRAIAADVLEMLAIGGASLSAAP